MSARAAGNDEESLLGVSVTTESAHMCCPNDLGPSNFRDGMFDPVPACRFLQITMCSWSRSLGCRRRKIVTDHFSRRPVNPLPIPSRIHHSLSVINCTHAAGTRVNNLSWAVASVGSITRGHSRSQFLRFSRLFGRRKNGRWKEQALLIGIQPMFRQVPNESSYLS